MYQGIELDSFGVPYQVAERIRIDGRPLKIPTLHAANPRLEAKFSLDRDPAMKSMMRNAAARKRGAMVDVGANIGQSLVKWASIDASRDYVGFEPNPASAFQCGSLIHLNELRSHRVIPIGISESFGLVELHLNGLFDPSASFVDGFRPDGMLGRKVDILALPGDEIIRSLGVEEIAFLKIDVEGAELEVLKSFQETIDKKRPLITFEVLPHFLLVKKEVLPQEQVKFRKQRYSQIEALLKSFDYKIFDSSGGGIPKPVKTIQPGPPGSETDIKNFLAVSSDFESELIANWI